MRRVKKNLFLTRKLDIHSHLKKGQETDVNKSVSGFASWSVKTVSLYFPELK